MRTMSTRSWALCAALGGCWLVLAASGCGPTLEQDRMHDIAADGVALYKRGCYREAREDFEFALKGTPADANLLFNLGQCYDKLGDPAKAEAYYQQCLTQNAKHAPCRQAVAQLLRDTDRRQQSEEFVEDWLRQEPALADAHALDGWRLRSDKQYEEAKGRLQEALKLDAHNLLALTELGLLYEELAHPERAVVLYEHALRVTPQDAALTARIQRLRGQGAGKPRPD